MVLPTDIVTEAGDTLVNFVLLFDVGVSLLFLPGGERARRDMRGQGEGGTAGAAPPRPPAAAAADPGHQAPRPGGEEEKEVCM